ncbi:MAG: glutathione S-transferase family protein [Pseudomonadota bacterium]
MLAGELQPITVYGSDISYFTGKLENYFRVRGIDYELRSMQFPADEKRFKQALGLSQMPTVQLGDGRWLTDTTKIIEWFEQAYPDGGLLPSDPLQAFVCLLIEDWADEWWWRPAMHYRWHYAEGAYLQSRHLADELLGGLHLPGLLKRWLLRRRQRDGYTRGDGIGAATVPGVEAMYDHLLQQLQAIFSARAFVLGESPSLADIGLSGPFFRHFALDPVPLQILRHRAPAVLEWVARLWNARPGADGPRWLSGIPEDLGPLLDEIGQGYLPYLCANAEAVAAGKKRFDVTVGGVSYVGARYSRYRVWCLQALRDHFHALPGSAQDEVQALLVDHGCWEALWRNGELPLQPGQEQGLPFRANYKMVGVNE